MTSVLKSLRFHLLPTPEGLAGSVETHDIAKDACELYHVENRGKLLSFGPEVCSWSNASF
jgi:hypothetical protein